MKPYLRATLVVGAALIAIAAAQAASAQTAADLMKMIEIERPSEVRSLLLKGVSPDSVDERGDSALVVASRSGQLPIVQTLLDAGAKVNLRNQWATPHLWWPHLMGAIRWCVIYAARAGTSIILAGPHCITLR